MNEPMPETPAGTPPPPSAPAELHAPIVAVTVYPGQARIVRRGRVSLPPGTGQVSLGGLPLGLDAESVRVTGRGPASIAGVDVTRAHRAVHELTGAEGRLRAEQRELARRRGESTDARSVLETQISLLQSLGTHAGRTFAKALADGGTEPGRLSPVTDYLTDQLGRALAARRELDESDRSLTDDERRLERQLARLDRQAPDSTVVLVELDVASAGPSSQPPEPDPSGQLPEPGVSREVELEVSYLVPGAGWVPRYDIRLEDATLAVDWFGLVRQRSGEDWPACELRLSTTRPNAAVTIPELDPWYLRDRPPAPQPSVRTVAGMADAAAYGGPVPVAAMAAPPGGRARVEAAEAPAPMSTAAAVAEQGVTATTYVVQRPTPIPPDGSDHQVLVASFALPARLEHVTAPVRSDDIVLRVRATNDTEHTVRPGRAALYHGPEFVGSTQLSTWAPGEELELALGLDDRIRVERKLVSRSAGKALVGGTRRHELRYRIEVSNYGTDQATITVLDQVPVSTSADIVVRDVVAEPRPEEVTDLGEVRWQLRLAPGQSTQLQLSFRVDTAKHVNLLGWRE